MGNYDKKIKGQCGTCAFAKGFTSADCPSGPEDAVECTSLEHTAMLDEQMQNKDKNYQNELTLTGSMNLWRLEALAEESYRCQNWKPR